MFKNFSSISILVKYERIKFLVIALKNAVEIYAWAPKPYHKFMAFKVCFVLLPKKITTHTFINRGFLQIKYMSFITGT